MGVFISVSKNKMSCLDLDHLDRAAIDSIQAFNFDGQTFVGRVIDIIDGDTIVIIMNAPAGAYHKYHIRLYGIDVCELKSNLKEQSKHIRKIVLEFLLKKHCAVVDGGTDLERPYIRDALVETPCIVSIACYRFDKYGRVLADVKRIRDGESVGQYLLNLGLAKPYFGGTKPTHSKENI